MKNIVKIEIKTKKQELIERLIAMCVTKINRPRKEVLDYSQTD